MLIHIYPYKPQRKIEVALCKITRLTTNCMCGLIPELRICNFIQGKVMHLMFLLRRGVIKQHKTNF